MKSRVWIKLGYLPISILIDNLVFEDGNILMYKFAVNLWISYSVTVCHGSLIFPNLIYLGPCRLGARSNCIVCLTVGPYYALQKFTMLKFCRFFVDDVPIRVFKNCKDLGVKFPFNQPMKIYSSLWNADDWATRGGREKTDWSKAPFIASYQSFHVDGCEASVEATYCDTQGKRWWDQKEFQDLDGLQYRKLANVRQKYTIYNYCTDRSRYPTMPPECKRDQDV